jgi:3-deoxy-D-manno-octulosonate 8-phosphate phosphatase (KDO 8-P phosphatase)
LNADKLAKKEADYITERKGGDRAVAEACLHILEMFFEAYNPKIIPKSKPTGRGEWGL